jgi:hypothetical protein
MKKLAIVKIDRSNPFDPASFLFNGWKIDEEDERSLALTNMDLSKIRFETCLKKGESYVRGAKRLTRLKIAKRVRLDAKIFQTLWENKELIPESWKEKTNGNTTYIHFDGIVLRDPNGNRDVLYLYFRGGEWHWSFYLLDIAFGAHRPSAVLASEPSKS